MDKPRLELTGSRLLTAWLASAKASLAFTTYQAGKLFLIGMKPDGRLYHLRPGLAGAAHLGLRLTGPVGPALLTRRFDWLYGHDVTRDAGGRGLPPA